MGATLLGLAEVGLAAVAVARLQFGFAAHRQGDRAVGTNLDQLFRGFEIRIGLAGLVVPLGQLLPAPVIVWFERDQRLHFAAGDVEAAAPCLDPGGPALQDHRRIGLEYFGQRGRLGFVEAAHVGQPFRLQIVGLDRARIERNRLVEGLERFFIVFPAVQQAHQGQPGSIVARPNVRHFAGRFDRFFGTFHALGPVAERRQAQS